MPFYVLFYFYLGSFVVDVSRIVSQMIYCKTNVEILSCLKDSQEISWQLRRARHLIAVFLDEDSAIKVVAVPLHI